MELERTGPLSYDVTAPDGDASAQRGIVFGFVTVAATMTVGLVGGWFALGAIRDSRVVTAGIPLALVVLTLAATAWGSRATMRRPRRNALLTMLAVSGAAALLSYNTLANIKAAVPQVQQALDDIDLPDGFRVVSESTHGDRFCRHGCPTVERRIAAPPDVADPVSTLVLAMFAQGWERTSDVEPAQATTARHNGIVTHLGENEPHVVYVTASRES